MPSEQKVESDSFMLKGLIHFAPSTKCRDCGKVVGRFPEQGAKGHFFLCGDCFRKKNKGVAVAISDEDGSVYRFVC